MISMNKKYKTKDGQDVRILATDIGNEAYPVVAELSGRGIHQFTKEGNFYSVVGWISESDLIEVSPYDGLKIDDKVIALFYDGIEVPAYFAGILHNEPTVFRQGRTSFTSIGSIPCLYVVPYTDE